MLGLCRCHPVEPPPLELVVGPAAQDQRTFVPQTAIAEQIVLPDRREIRLVFAEGVASCERYVAPEPGKALVHVTIVGPPDKELGPGTYLAARPTGKDETWVHPQAAYALAKVEWASTNMLLGPGGGVQLTAIDWQPHGTVQGTMSFEFPGDDKSPAASLRGRFIARGCQPHE